MSHQDTDRRREPIKPEDLRVDRGRTVGDLRTVADCDAALLELRTAIEIMSARIATARANQKRTPEEDLWLRRASVASSLKRGAIKAVRDKRELLLREGRVAREKEEDVALLRLFRERFPQEFRACLDELKQARA